MPLEDRKASNTITRQQTQSSHLPQPARVAMEAPPPSRLLELPPELRIMIYSFTFEPLLASFEHTKDVKDLEPTALFQVCRQIRTETVPQYQKWFHASSGLFIPPEISHDVDNSMTAMEHLEAPRRDIDLLRAHLHETKCELVIKARCSVRASGTVGDSEGLALSIDAMRKLAAELEELNKENERVMRRIVGARG